MRKTAYMDTLTGVGSKLAYAEEEAAIDEAIHVGSMSDLAVVVCEVNGLKHVIDACGHAARDECIREACKLLCDVFAHGQVYRIGGDEFVALVRGEEYEHRNELPTELDWYSMVNLKNDGAVVPTGRCTYERSNSRNSAHECVNAGQTFCARMRKSEWQEQ